MEMNQCCLHKSKVVHEGEREIRPKWPAIYTFLERGKWWQRRTISVVWRTILTDTIGCLVSNNIGDLFQIQSFWHLLECPVPFASFLLPVVYFVVEIASMC
jgi:hypothetical protein